MLRDDQIAMMSEMFRMEVVLNKLAKIWGVEDECTRWWMRWLLTGGLVGPTPCCWTLPVSSAVSGTDKSCLKTGKSTELLILNTAFERHLLELPRAKRKVRLISLYLAYNIKNSRAADLQLRLFLVLFQAGPTRGLLTQPSLQYFDSLTPSNGMYNPHKRQSSPPRQPGNPAKRTL